jgi:hypothetical protein
LALLWGVFWAGNELAARNEVIATVMEGMGDTLLMPTPSEENAVNEEDGAMST